MYIYILVYLYMKGLTMQKQKRLILDIKEEDHTRIKVLATKLGMTIKEYVLKVIAKDMYERERLK